MNHIYQIILKEGNYDHNYLRCLDLLGKNFDVLLVDITLDKIFLACVDTVREKLTGKNAGFITYSNTIYFLDFGYITVTVL